MDPAIESIPEEEPVLSSEVGCRVAAAENYPHCPDDRLGCAEHHDLKAEARVDCEHHAYEIQEIRRDVAMLRRDQERLIDTLSSLTASVAYRCARQSEKSMRMEMHRFQERIVSDLDDRCKVLERQILSNLMHRSETDSEQRVRRSASARREDIKEISSGENELAAIDARVGCWQDQNHKLGLTSSSLQVCAHLSKQSLLNMDGSKTPRDEKSSPSPFARSVAREALQTDERVASSPARRNHSPAAARPNYYRGSAHFPCAVSGSRAAAAASRYTS